MEDKQKRTQPSEQLTAKLIWDGEKKGEKPNVFVGSTSYSLPMTFFLNFMSKRALTENFEVCLGLHKLLDWILDRYLTYSHLSKDLVKPKQILGGLFPKESLKHKGHIMNT